LNSIHILIILFIHILKSELIQYLIIKNNKNIKKMKFFTIASLAAAAASPI
jgi:hypothetical protein